MSFFVRVTFFFSGYFVSFSCTARQKSRLVGPARLTAWRLSNELRTTLKELLLEAEGPYASLSWLPDVPFTRLLQVTYAGMHASA